jgi:hypothetical protein
VCESTAGSNPALSAIQPRSPDLTGRRTCRSVSLFGANDRGEVA